MRILATSGTEYIGSHTCTELLSLGHEVMVVDNLCSSPEESPNRVEETTGKKPVFYQVGLLDKEGLEAVLAKETMDTVIHFAGLKTVGESVAKPLEYHHNDTTGTPILCDVMRNHGVGRIILSPSTTVYGDPVFALVTEGRPKGKVTNPYGQIKGMLKQILMDLYTVDPEWSVILLRYFNPVGVHKSGLIGEDPTGVSNNLTPYITQVVVRKSKEVGVFGDSYDTPDGTGVRDYIHVADLTIGRVKTLDRLMEDDAVRIYNLGTGYRYSALDVIEAFSKACGKEIPYVIKSRRLGDIAIRYASPALTERELGWKTERGLKEMCEDNRKWQSNNPNGYRQQIIDKVIVTYC